GSIGTQRYLGNTNVLETRFTTSDGAFRVIDFAPRFMQFGRSFRPQTLVRIVEPLAGIPQLRVSCRPRLGWSKQPALRELGSNHVSYGGYPCELRLTTDVPLSYLDADRPFTLTARRHFLLAYGAPLEDSLPAVCERFLQETIAYWELWVKHCDVPPRYQREVIRSA